MINLLEAFRELYSEIYKNHLEDNLSEDTADLVDRIETFFNNDPGQNLVVVLGDKEVYDVTGHLIFIDEAELEEITDGGYIPDLIEENRWILLGEEY